MRLVLAVALALAVLRAMSRYLDFETALLVVLLGTIGLLTVLVLAVDVLHRAADRATGPRRARFRHAAQLAAGLVWTIVASALLVGLVILALAVLIAAMNVM